jgi:hypothetical protein
VKTNAVVLTAAILYVAAWLVGLFVAPARPTTGGDAATRQYFVDHVGAAITQSILVHGVAGVALGLFAVTLARLLTAPEVSSGTTRGVLLLGLGAAALSLAQVAVLLSVATRAGSLADQVAADRAQWINYVDVAKLCVVAAFVVSATRAAGAAGLIKAWVTPLAFVVATLLFLGGISFLVESSILTAALFISLPLLLIWVGVVGVSAYRNAPDEAALGAAESVR